MNFMRLKQGRYLLFFVCFIGCLYHLLIVSYHYFNFKVRTEITFDFPTLVTIPEIDIAIPIVSIINMSALYERHPEDMIDICKFINRNGNWSIDSIEDFNKFCLSITQTTVLTNEELVGAITVGDIEELTGDPSKIIRGVYFDDYSMNLVRANVCTIHKYFNGIYVFLRISCRNGSEPITKRILQTYSGNAYLLCIELLSKDTFGFNLSPINSSLAARLRQYVIVDYKPDASRFIYARWHRFISTSLPWPYETNCENYDRSKTLVNCINKRLLELENPAVFIDSIIPFGDFSPDLKFADDVLTNFDSDLLDSIFHDCQRLIIRPECEKIIYLTSSNEHTEATNGVAHHEGIALCLGTPLDTDTHYTTLPQQTTIEYLIYISSILGIWFGISIYGQLRKRRRYIAEFPNHDPLDHLELSKRWCRVSRPQPSRGQNTLHTLHV